MVLSQSYIFSSNAILYFPQLSFFLFFGVVFFLLGNYLEDDITNPMDLGNLFQFSVGQYLFSSKGPCA